MSELLVDNFDNIDSTALTTTTETLRKLWQSSDSSVDTRFGMLNTLVLQPNALLNELILENLAEWNSSTNLNILAETDDTTLQAANADLLNRLVANYKIVRKNGRISSGTVQVKLSSDRGLTIPYGYKFTTEDGLVFKTTAVYHVRNSSSSIISPTDLLITKYDDTQFQVIIPVVSASQGDEYNIQQGTVLTCSGTFPGLVSVSAYETFSLGTNIESNSSLVNRVIDYISYPVLNGKSNMSASLEDSGYTVISNNIIGIGQQEMLRDTHAVFPISYGGKADWYMQTALLPITSPTAITATCVAVTGTTRVWKVVFDRSFSETIYYADNFYSSDNSIHYSHSSSNSYPFEARTIDNTPLANEIVPEIVNAAEVLYSPYQVVTYHITESTSTAAVGDTTSVMCDVTYMPYMRELQIWVVDSSRSMVSGDILVRAHIPCEVTIAMKIKGNEDLSATSISSIKQELITAINTQSFDKSIPKSYIYEIIQSIIGPKKYIYEFSMAGTIYCMNDVAKNYITMIKINGEDTLELPSLSSYPVLTQNTVCFFTSANRIQIN